MKPNQDYDMEICGECHGKAEQRIHQLRDMGDWYTVPCPNCKDSPRPGYVSRIERDKQGEPVRLTFSRQNIEGQP